MDIQKIKKLALANGFKLKEQASGNMDLHSYVYEFAQAVAVETINQAQLVFGQDGVTVFDTETLDSEISNISSEFEAEYFFDNDDADRLELLVAKAMKLGELYERQKWQQAQKVAVPNIGLKVEIINPDDTVKDGVKIGDQGVIVWIDDEHKVYGINFPKSGETFAYARSDFKVIQSFGVPEGFVLVEKNPSEELVNYGHQVFLGHFNEGGQTGGRALYFAYKAMIEAQEPTND